MNNLPDNYIINDVDVDKVIEEGLILTLRYLFYLSQDKFKWDMRADESNVSIITEFADRQIPHKETCVILTGLDWSASNNNALGQNIAEPIYDDNLIQVGDNFRTIINFNCRFICEADGMNSKDLANKVASILFFSGKKVLAKYGITIYNINKGATGPKLQNPSKIFQTPVGITASVEWKGFIKYISADKMDILKAIKISLDVENESTENRDYIGPGTVVV